MGAPGGFIVRHLIVDLQEKSEGQETRGNRRPTVILAVEEREIIITKNLMPMLAQETVERLATYNSEKLSVTIENRFLRITLGEHLSTLFANITCDQQHCNVRAVLPASAGFLAALLGKRMTIQEIAEALSLSPPIISTYRARIFFKTGMTSTQDIVQYVIDHNLLAVK